MEVYIVLSLFSQLRNLLPSDIRNTDSLPQFESRLKITFSVHLLFILTVCSIYLFFIVFVCKVSLTIRKVLMYKTYHFYYYYNYYFLFVFLRRSQGRRISGRQLSGTEAKRAETGLVLAAI